VPGELSVSKLMRNVPFPARQPLSPPRQPEEPFVRRAAPPPPPSVHQAPPPPAPNLDAVRQQYDQEMIRRFAEGANIPAALLSGKTGGDLAFEMGELLRLVCANLMQLLKARAEMKAMVRTTDRTMIEVRENNALKFTPTVEAALSIMFGQPAAGYLDAKATLERSFSDIKAHEAATYSAMQQALLQLMEDLAPEAIEQSAGSNKLGFLGGKSRYWELFSERWAAKAGAGEHGILDAFLDEFAAHYEAAIPRRRS
jgi:type VI secretion system protein ImpI